jgi:putative ABC transport system ATP-binding protein
VSDSSFIRCRSLTRTYHRGDVEITPLKNLELDIERGEFLALMGPSGSGKTTLLNLLGGIDRPTAGTLHVADQAVHALSRSALAAWRGRTIGYIFQLYNLVPVLTAYENVELPLLLRPLARRERHRRVAAALDLVGISDRHDHLPRQLSGGQEQRVAIARAIVTEPQLLLADEPTGDLDRESAEHVMRLLDRLNTDLGQTIVMVTHDAKIAARAHHTVMLEKGRLVTEAQVVTEAQLAKEART